MVGAFKSFHVDIEGSNGLGSTAMGLGKRTQWVWIFQLKGQRNTTVQGASLPGLLCCPWQLQGPRGGAGHFKFKKKARLRVSNC